MRSKNLKLHYDRLGIFTAIACAVHCTILPLAVSSIPFLGVEALENKAVEWSMILMALVFGLASLGHGYKNHHRKFLPLVLFITGFCFLLLNQLIAERFVYIFIPVACACIICAHVLNIYYCRISGRCKVHDRNCTP